MQPSTEGTKTYEGENMDKDDTLQTGHLMAISIALIMLGAIAIATPAVAGTTVVLVIGGLLLMAGFFQFVQGLRAESWMSKVFPAFLGLVTMLCGIGVLAHPLLGLSFLTLLLAGYFMIEGIWKMIASFGYRRFSGWPLMLVSGMLSLVLGILIWRQWPVSGLWAVGILVGIDLLMTGVSMIALAITVRRFHRAAAGARPA